MGRLLDKGLSSKDASPISSHGDDKTPCQDERVGTSAPITTRDQVAHSNVKMLLCQTKNAFYSIEVVCASTLQVDVDLSKCRTYRGLGHYLLDIATTDNPNWSDGVVASHED
ncbi:hypothetical protein PoB_004075400 [Plakobranchus ocellatus]|uniref:Uncharacterized protein n=1 Tax=Plakobranchus ocellatus TaxID=259542 RepID=A0AAV4B7B3_9GAST|nr:hypothetical protein PoB_004075400 [Plakobranchus ocellatus]